MKPSTPVRIQVRTPQRQIITVDEVVLFVTKRGRYVCQFDAGKGCTDVRLKDKSDVELVR